MKKIILLADIYECEDKMWKEQCLIGEHRHKLDYYLAIKDERVKALEVVDTCRANLRAEFDQHENIHENGIQDSHH